MKLLKNISVVLLTGVLLLSATLAGAQEKKYKVNSLWDNFFITAGGGVSMLTEDNQPFFNGKVKGGYDFGFGKWFSPQFGFRLGFQGGTLAEYVSDPRHLLTTPTNFRGMETNELGVRYHYVHNDFLWNFSNTVAGYSRDRVYEFIPYIHMGVFRTYAMDKTGIKREYAPGVGVINNFRVSDAVSLYIDLRATFVNGRNIKRPRAGGALETTANAGLTYNIGKSWWTSDVGRPNDRSLVHNSFFDNMYIGVMGGVSVLSEGGQQIRFNGNASGSFDIVLGKWFSPYFGGRIGYSGGSLSEWLASPRPGMSNIPGMFQDKAMYLNKMDYSYLHAEILWDVVNSFIASGKRPFGISPYIHLGYMNTRPYGTGTDINGMGGGFGVLGNFRLIDKLDLLIDARAMALKGEMVGHDRGFAFQGTAFAGLAYNIGRRDFPESSAFEFLYEDRQPTGPSPYVVSAMKNNWFISVGAGGSLIWEPKSTLGAAGVTPSLDISVGKWFTPWTAIRLGYQGYRHKIRSMEPRQGLDVEYVENNNGKSYYINSFNYGYVHADFLWDATNTFRYDRYRVWSLIPYTHMGVMRSYLPRNYQSYKRSYVMGFGLINSFRVGRNTSVYVDLRSTFIDNAITRRPVHGGSDIALNAMVGATVDLTKVNYFKSHADTTAVSAPVFGRWKDNIFVQLGGGVNVLFEEGFSQGMNIIPAPAYEVSLGKWFSPDFGVRLGYQGGGLKEWLDEPRPLLATTPGVIRGVPAYKLDAKYDYFHADVLWDLTNLIYPHRYDRIWSLIPYYHTGFYNVRTAQGKLYRDGFAAGFGLINTIRISSELGAFLDLRATVLNANMLGRGQNFGYKGTALAGLTYNIGGVGNWTTAAQYRRSGYKQPLKATHAAGPSPYLDNKLWENLFISVGGGVNMLFERQISTAGFSPAFDVNIGKWLSPQFAVRLGVQGASMVEHVRDYRFRLAENLVRWANEDRYRFENKYFYIHTDFLWNLNNTFTPYDYNRIWNIMPYYQFGVIQGYYTSGSAYKQEYSMGYGLLNTFRLSDRLNAFIDLRANLIRHRMLHTTGTNGAMLTALAGVSYDVGKNYWTSYKKVPNSYEYALNEFKDNWWLSVSGGVSLLQEGGQKGFNGDAGWTADISVGKWLSPQFAGRIGYQRGTIKDWTTSPRFGRTAGRGTYGGSTMYGNEYQFGYVHADLLWSILTTILGYDEYRVYDLIPYVHTGQYTTYFGSNRQREFAAGVGILNNFNFSSKWTAFADLRLFSLKGESVGKQDDKAFSATLMAGLTYNIGKSSFRTANRLNTLDRTGKLSGEKVKVETGLPPFLANRLFDNIFVSAAVGTNMLGELKSSSEIGASFGFDINFGKWYNPYFGNRIGVLGSTLSQTVKQARQGITTGPDQFGGYQYKSRFYYLHADFMWEATNTIGGYKRDRVWSVVPYGHFGFAQNFYTKGSSFKREFAYGVGLLNNIRIIDKFRAFADLRFTTMSGRFVRQQGVLPVITSLFAGFTYDLNKNYWQSYTEGNENQYVLKNFHDGWFIGVSGGIMMAAEGGQTSGANTAPTGNAEFTFGKWFSPDFGGRIGFQAGTLSEWLDVPRDGASTIIDNVGNNQMYKSVLSFSYAHADLMWDMFNTFMGPNPERKWDLIPYAHSGFIRTNQVTGGKFANGLAGGLGLFANYHIDEEFGLFADGRLYCLKSNTLGKREGFAFATSINAGVSYNFGGKNWKKATEYKPDGKKEHFEKDYRSFALSTNLLSWLNLGTINVEAQYEVARHWTVEGKIKYNPWTLNKGVVGQFQEDQRGFAIGARWWPWYSFAGWWIGMDAQYKNYRTGGLPWFKTPEQGTAVGASLGFGYSVLITKWFNLDFGISGWAGHKNFTNFEDSRFLTPTGKGNKWFVAPNELSVSAVFIF